MEALGSFQEVVVDLDMVDHPSFQDQVDLATEVLQVDLATVVQLEESYLEDTDKVVLQEEDLDMVVKPEVSVAPVAVVAIGVELLRVKLTVAKEEMNQLLLILQ